MSKEQMELFTIAPNGKRVSTGRYAPRGTQVEAGFYIVGVNNWIINKDGKILVQKRAKTKKNNPSKWSSTNGLIIPGETNVETVMRETREELGIELNPENIWFMESIVADTTLIVDIFVSYADIDISQIKLQEEEVEEFRFVTVDELLKLDISTTCQYVLEIYETLFGANKHPGK